VRVAGRPAVPGTASLTPRPGSSAGTWTPSTSSTPGQGSAVSRRLPSRSTWSKRLAIWARPRPPGPTRSCSRASAEPQRAAGVRDRTTSRIRPTAASPSGRRARSAQAGVGQNGSPRRRRSGRAPALRLGCVRSPAGGCSRYWT
jgi:hypothetical protein